jgi:predicted amidohydrolase
MTKVGYYQFHPLFGDIRGNVGRVVTTLKEVDMDIIVLPELPFSGYNFKDREELKSLSEEIGKSSTIDTLIQLCKERDFFIVSGFAEKSSDKYFNSSLLLGPEGVIHTYRKLHLFNNEKNWFDPGDIELRVNEVRGIKIGMMVCFDWIFPEVCRGLSVLGADLVCHPSNLVLQYCQQTMLSRSLENAVYTITANRIGSDNRPHGEIEFTGKSQVVSPKGELLINAPANKEVLHLIEIDIEMARDKMMTPVNHRLEDRRPEFYNILSRRNE